MSIFSVLALAGPLLLLATTVVTLWSYGPLGWLAAVLLVVAVVAACVWAWRVTRRWWAGTKAPVRPSTTVPARRASQLDGPRP
jgi:hypothetical protein